MVVFIVVIGDLVSSLELLVQIWYWFWSYWFLKYFIAFQTFNYTFQSFTIYTIYIYPTSLVGSYFLLLFTASQTYLRMDRSRVCSCGAAMPDGDNHVKCMLCLGNHDMSLCPVYKSMSTPAKTLRRRAYNDAVILWWVCEDISFLPYHSQGLLFLSKCIQVRKWTEHHVGSYFHSLEDRHDDEILDQDDGEADKHVDIDRLHHRPLLRSVWLI